MNYLINKKNQYLSYILHQVNFNDAYIPKLLYLVHNFNYCIMLYKSVVTINIFGICKLIPNLHFCKGIIEFFKGRIVWGVYRLLSQKNKIIKNN